MSLTSSITDILIKGRKQTESNFPKILLEQQGQEELQQKFSEIEAKNNKEIYNRLSPHLMDLGAKETLVVAENGQFVQSPAGANYNNPQDNPFINDGVKCMKCLFFNPTNNSCSIVEGNIESEASCRFYVIPVEDLEQ